VGAGVDFANKRIFLEVAPDRRYKAVCAHCVGKIVIHQHGSRIIGDIPLWDFSVFIRAHYRKGDCVRCGKIVVERLDYTKPGLRMTSRLAEFILAPGRKMSDSDISRLLGLSWDVVRKVHYDALLHEYGDMDYGSPRLLAVDEIAICKGHKYATVIVDIESGRVVSIEEDRTTESLMSFYQMFIRMAVESRIKEIRDFAAKVFRHIRYIVNHAKYKITTGIVEGISNKIKNIKRRAYGIKDLQYLKLLAINTFY